MTKSAGVTLIPSWDDQQLVTPKRMILFNLLVMKETVLSVPVCYLFLNSGYEEQKLALESEVTLLPFLAHCF